MGNNVLNSNSTALNSDLDVNSMSNSNNRLENRANKVGLQEEKRKRGKNGKLRYGGVGGGGGEAGV